jgi:predicted flavoprotein YhiN
MVLATEIILPPRRHSFNGPEPASKSPPKSNWWFFTSKLKPAASNFGSSHTVAIQKLRESKWFKQDEERLFCAVIESGFIVEIMLNEQNGDELKSHYGVVSVEPKKSEFLLLMFDNT